MKTEMKGHINFRKAILQDVPNIVELYFSMFGYVFKSFFKGNESTIKLLISKTILSQRGSSYWGYDNTMVAAESQTNMIVAMMVYNLGKKKVLFRNLFFIGDMMTSILYHTGVKGLYFSIKNMIRNRGAIPNLKKNNELYIAYLAVHKNYRKLGIAKTFLKYAEELALSQNYYALGLDIREDNLPAKTLFTKQGFLIVQTFNKDPFNQNKRFYMRKTLCN